MDLFHDTHFDFMKYRRFWVIVSFLVILAGIFAVFFLHDLNIGIDFAGGTQLTLKFREKPNVEELRSVLEAAGFRDAQLQRFGAVGDNQVLIRTPVVAGNEEGGGARVVAAIDAKFNPGRAGTDLNAVGTATVAELLQSGDPDHVGAEAAPEHYRAIAEKLFSLRKTMSIFTSWDQVAAAEAMTPAALAELKAKCVLGNFAVLGLENVGPQVGAELRKRGTLAVFWALAGMLVYIWFRFELRYGIGATMATIHDVLVTLGLYAFAGYEFNLTTIAAFLTLVGYSCNDTVVTFDRVRENLRKNPKEPLLSVMNRSINQTLSRTILTGGTVFLASFTLFLFGGDVIRGFAFIMTVGVIVGTYSSIYIASPFALLWEKYFGSGKAQRPQEDAKGAKSPATAVGAPAKRRA
ncbi:MAG: protein translocase subunit SecF [Thermoanaerobaculia bacterium]